MFVQARPHGADKLILTHHLVVQAVNARRAEEEKFVISNLPLDEHGLVELLATDGTFLCVQLFRRFALLDDGFEADECDEEDKSDEDGCEDGDGH